MIDKLVLLEKMRQFGIDWIDTVGFMDEGQINAVLDIAEHGYLYCPDCGYRE